MPKLTIKRVNTEAIERAAVGKLLILAGGGQGEDGAETTVVHLAESYTRQAICGYALRVDAHFHTQITPAQIRFRHELCSACFPDLDTEEVEEEAAPPIVPDGYRAVILNAEGVQVDALDISGYGSDRMFDPADLGNEIIRMAYRAQQREGGQG